MYCTIMKKITSYILILSFIFSFNPFFIPPAKAYVFEACNAAILRINQIGGFNFQAFNSQSDSMIVLGKTLSCGSPANAYQSIFMMLEPTRYFVTDNHIQAYSQEQLRNPPGTCIYQDSKKVIKTKMHSGCN